MKKHIFVIIVLSMNLQFLFSQFDLNIFKEYQPVWMYATKDTTAFDYPGYFDNNKIWLSEDFVKGDYLYSLYEYQLQANLVDGGIVEKLNLNSGTVEWQDVYDLRTIEKNEEPNNMFINLSGDIEVLGLRNKERDEKDGGSRFNDLVIRRYDNETGVLKQYVFPQPDDTERINLPWLVDRGLFDYNTEEYQLIRTYGDFGENFVWGYILDEDGKLLHGDTTYFDDGFEMHKKFTMNMVGNDTLTMLLFSHNTYSQIEDSFDFKYYIKLFDRRLNELNSFDITDDLNAKNRFRMEPMYSDNKYIVYRYVNEPEFFDWRYYFMIYDYQGNFQDSINLLDIGIPQANLTRISEDEFLVCGEAFEAGEYNPLYFYKKKIGEPIQFLKKIELKKKDFALVPISLYVLDNNDILFNGYYRPITLSFQDKKTYFPIKIRFAAKDIDITSSKEIDIKESKLIYISPNPAKSSLTLDFDDVFSGNIVIFDALGRSVLDKTLQNAAKQDVDISGLPNGIYFVKAIDMHGQKEFKTARFVKE